MGRKVILIQNYIIDHSIKLASKIDYNWFCLNNKFSNHNLNHLRRIIKIVYGLMTHNQKLILQIMMLKLKLIQIKILDIKLLQNFSKIIKMTIIMF